MKYQKFSLNIIAEKNSKLLTNNQNVKVELSISIVPKTISMFHLGADLNKPLFLKMDFLRSPVPHITDDVLQIQRLGMKLNI